MRDCKFLPSLERCTHSATCPLVHLHRSSPYHSTALLYHTTASRALPLSHLNKTTIRCPLNSYRYTSCCRKRILACSPSFETKEWVGVLRGDSGLRLPVGQPSLQLHLQAEACDPVVCMSTQCLQAGLSTFIQLIQKPINCN